MFLATGGDMGKNLLIFENRPNFRFPRQKIRFIKFRSRLMINSLHLETVFSFSKTYTMKRKDKRRQVILIGRQDRLHRHWRMIFPNFGLTLYQVLEPQKSIDWSAVEPADIIITQLDDLGYGFTECELLDTVITLYPNKIIIAETDDYSPDISAKAQAMGAHGYIHRDELEEILGEALNKIISGERFFMGLPSHLQN